MKKSFFSLLFYFLTCHLFAQQVSGQQKFEDSLLSIVNGQPDDSNKVNALAALSLGENAESGIRYGEEGAALAGRLNYKKGEAACLFGCATSYNNLNNNSQCIYFALKTLDLFEELKDYRGIAETKLMVQGNYRALEDYDRALMYSLSGEALSEAHQLISNFDFPGHRLAPLFAAEIAKTYLDKNRLDSAMLFTRRSHRSKRII